MKKMVLAITIALTSLPTFANVENCSEKTQAITQEIAYAKQHNNMGKLRGLQTALANVKANCTDEKQSKERKLDLEKKQLKISERENDLKEAEQELKEAKQDGRYQKIQEKTEKVEDKQKKLEKAKWEFQKAQEGASRY